MGQPFNNEKSTAWICPRPRLAVDIPEKEPIRLVTKCNDVHHNIFNIHSDSLEKRTAGRNSDVVSVGALK